MLKDAIRLLDAALKIRCRKEHLVRREIARFVDCFNHCTDPFPVWRAFVYPAALISRTAERQMSSRTDAGSAGAGLSSINF